MPRTLKCLACHFSENHPFQSFTATLIPSRLPGKSHREGIHKLLYLLCWPFRFPCNAGIVVVAGIRALCRYQRRPYSDLRQYNQRLCIKRTFQERSLLW
jgi:hypothetical protein